MRWLQHWVEVSAFSAAVALLCCVASWVRRVLNVKQLVRLVWGLATAVDLASESK